MATEAPWEVIRAAADKLAELAENATAGLWRCHDTRPGFGGGTTTVLAEQQPVDGEWLRAAATVLEGYGCYWVMVPDWVRSAGDLAATILGVELWTGSVDHG